MSQEAETHTPPDLVCPSCKVTPLNPPLRAACAWWRGFPCKSLFLKHVSSVLRTTMSPDETVYLAVLLISIPVGFLFKKVGLKTKKYGAAVIGLAFILVTCQIHILHSLITILGTWLIINISPRTCHHLTLGWTFSYLFFFRTVTYFNYPEPTPFTNAVQLLLTLKLLSLANEVQELIQAKKQEVTTFTKSPMIGRVLQKPGLVEILCYSYCYVGLMTELDDMLLDQLVYGLRDLRLQRHLLAKGDLTLKLAIEEAQAAEMSNLSAAEIQGATSSPATKPNPTVHFEEITPDENLDYGEDVNRLTNRQQLQQQRSWNSGNKPQQYPTAQVICLSCGGPFYRYRTYHDWLSQTDSSVIPSWRPMLYRFRMIPIFGIFFLVVSHFFPLDYVRSNAFYERGLPFRLFYMVPIFFVFRMRFYVAWLCAESADREASSIAYDYETIKNIDPHGTDFCVKIKDGMRYWNMTVQWWLAQYIYKSAPFHSYVMRSAWTMLISAYWHGIHPGYYISFLTIPLCLAAEGAMESGFLKHLSPSGRLWGDWIQWFMKMRAYDYMCMGFVLLTFEDTIRYWSSIYYCIHVGAVFFFLLGTVLGIQRKRGSPKDKQGAPQNPKQQE
ncbi:hypothetical protein E2320_003209 [Naja naja]|nr:hypothetical protein E2320_003209 [Naja naja]